MLSLRHFPTPPPFEIRFHFRSQASLTLIAVLLPQFLKQGESQPACQFWILSLPTITLQECQDSRWLLAFSWLKVGCKDRTCLSGLTGVLFTCQARCEPPNPARAMSLVWSAQGTAGPFLRHQASAASIIARVKKSKNEKFNAVLISPAPPRSLCLFACFTQKEVEFLHLKSPSSDYSEPWFARGFSCRLCMNHLSLGKPLAAQGQDTQS